jgi:plasmid stability protein
VKKKIITIIIAILILITALIILAIHDRAKHHRSAEKTLSEIIQFIVNNRQNEYIKLEVAPDVNSLDFENEYNIVLRDYTWGTWEFVVVFPNNKAYYFDFSFNKNRNKIRAYVRPTEISNPPTH